MNKEPIGLYIFRFILGFALFGCACMIYWSTVLIELDLKTTNDRLLAIKNDISQFQDELSNIRNDFLTSTTYIKDNSDIKVVNEKKSDSPNSASDLLVKDPFYAVTLPKLLPKNFKPQGTFQRATIGKPNNLHPFSEWSHISEWNSLCNVSLAKMLFGKFETMTPDMALRIEERINEGSEVPEFWVFLRDRVFWEPLDKKFFPNTILSPHFFKKHQVTSEDFKFYFDAIMNPYMQEAGAVALRNYLGDITEIEIVDKLTFIVRWKTVKIDGKETIKYSARQLTGGLKPLASFVYKYFPNGNKIVEDDSKGNTYRTNSVWAQNFSQHWAKNIIVSCGPWLFDGMSDRQIQFRRNPNFYDPLAALAEKIIITFKSTPEAIWQSFKIGELDSYAIQPDQLVDLENFMESSSYKTQSSEGQQVNRLDYIGRTYSYIGWNQAKPYFRSTKVRQAMTMAIDRQRIIQQNLNGLAEQITGTFYPHSSAYDPSIEPWPFDPQVARRLLEEEGWYDSKGTGVIEKIINGVSIPFEFNLTYFARNPLSKAISEYIATALKEVGVICNLNGVDLADLSAKFEDKSFDALFLGWALGTPPEEPRQLWHSDGAKQQGSSNAVGFANEEVDAIIKKLEYEYNPKERINLYHRFDAIIHQEQPYTFLFCPKTAFLYREYLQNVFIPADRQDLIPGADYAEPDPNIFWISR